MKFLCAGKYYIVLLRFWIFNFRSVSVRFWRKNLGFGFGSGFPAPACWSVKAQEMRNMTRNARDIRRD